MISRSLFSLILLMAAPLYAEEAAPATEDISLFQIVMPLLLVISLIFVLAWLVKKMNSGVAPLGKGIKVVGSTPLSSHARACLVEVGDKTLLLGVTNQQVTVLETFEESPLPDQPEENPGHFASEFKRLLKGNKHADH